MNIICLGINHRTAPASLREQLSYTESKLKAMLARSSHGEREAVTPFSELGVLSTCNRVEIYAVASKPDARDLAGLLAETSGVSDVDLEGHTYIYRGSEAAGHLFRVASGLDSLVLGEPQILGQVSDTETILELDRLAFEPIWQISRDSLAVAIIQASSASLIEDSGEVLGYQITTSSPFGAHLARLAVLPTRQREGLGTLLVNEAVESVRETGLGQLSVNTQENNHSSRRLYEKMGFMQTGKEFPVLELEL